MRYETFDPKIHDVYKVASLVYDVDFRTFDMLFKSSDKAIDRIAKSIEDEDLETFKVILDDDGRIIGILIYYIDKFPRHFYLRSLRLLIVDILDYFVLSDVGHGDLLGRVALIPVDNKYVLNQRVALLRINKKNVIPRYLYYFINVHQQYFKILGAGSSQLNIGKEVVESFRVLLPNIEEQKAIAQFLYNIDKNIECQQQKLEKLKQIKESFLSKMFV